MTRLVNQASKMPTRKVQYATIGAAVGGLLGQLIAAWALASFPFLLIVPGVNDQIVNIVQMGLVAGFSGVGALVNGYFFRDREPDFVPYEKDI
jgi:O-antigen/teichoic acid export membrane protein